MHPGGRGWRAALLRAIRSSESPALGHHFLCFRVLIVEVLEIFAACLAFASARRTPQKHGETLIFEQRTCVDLIFVLIRRFSKIVIFPDFVGVFCAHSNARQTTTSNLCASNTEVWKQWQNSV